jgi:hypothetical protein
MVEILDLGNTKHELAWKPYNTNHSVFLALTISDLGQRKDFDTQYCSSIHCPPRPQEDTATAKVSQLDWFDKMACLCPFGLASAYL